MVNPRVRTPSFLHTVMSLIVALLLLPYLLVLVYAVVPPVSTVMLVSLLSGQGMARHWVPLSQVSLPMQRAVLVAEDARFCEHWGLDFEAIEKSLKTAERTGRAPKGASTISAQVVKNLFFINGRSWVRKVLEAPLALWLDLVLPKRRVLEIYLNIAEWGKGRFGVEAAAQAAFGKSAARLNNSEAALLAAALPAPTKRDAARPRPYHRGYAATIQARMHKSAGIVRCVSAVR
jgi:monofunctional biosynthetic peptidoglycan transglycosylase